VFFDTPYEGTTEGATYDFVSYLPQACENAYGSGLVWYSFKGKVDQTCVSNCSLGNGDKVSISTCSPNTQIDTEVWVFKAEVCGALIQGNKEWNEIILQITLNIS
jgi:hypothetical protein